MRKYIPLITVIFLAVLFQVVTGIPMHAGLCWLHPTIPEIQRLVILFILQFVQLMLGVIIALIAKETFK